MAWNPKRLFIAAEKMQESGGDYMVVNASSGALGAYQVMPANLEPWLRASGEHTMSAYWYLRRPRVQDAVAWHVLGGYYDRYGARGAAAMWYSGQSNPNATYGNPPVYQYVDDVIKWMDRISGGKVNVPGGTVILGGGAAPKPTNWSSTITHSAERHKAAANAFKSAAARLHNL